MPEETEDRDCDVDCVCVAEFAAESDVVTPGVAVMGDDAEPRREAEVVEDAEKDAVPLVLMVEDGEMDVVLEALLVGEPATRSKIKQSTTTVKGVIAAARGRARHQRQRSEKERKESFKERGQRT